jgi:hypothetical protein
MRSLRVLLRTYPGQQRSLPEHLAPFARQSMRVGQPVKQHRGE